MAAEKRHGTPIGSGRDHAYVAAIRRLMATMSTEVTGTSDLEVVSGMLVQAGKELVPSADCVITVVPPERPDVLQVLAGAGEMASRLPGTEWQAAGTLDWRAMKEGRVVESTDLHADSAGLPSVFAAGGVNTARLLPLRTGTALPGGRVSMGVLGFWRSGNAPFSSDDRGQMDDLGELAGVFIRQVELERAASKSSNRLAGIEELKSDFLNLASHELRGPLAVVQGYLSMMEDGELKGRQLRAVLPILSAKLRQMNLLVNEMLDIARLEDHRLHLTLMAIDLGATTRRVAEASMGQLRPQHHLELVCPQDMVTVRADPTRLETIVTNLVDNAIKYSPAGGEVRVSVTRAGDLARVMVTDHGLGIAEQDLPRLFTRFGRLVTPENSHIPGTGLGLYLSRQLARMHGGDISVASRAGAGSTFTLTLPV